MNGWDEVGDRIFRRRYESLDLNIGAVLGEDVCLVVDSRATYRQADELRADLRSLTPAPVRYLVNTHHHWDHTFGNGRFPDSEVVGHVECASQLLAVGPAMKSDLRELVTEDERTAIDAIELVPPTVTFTKSLNLEVGGRQVRLEHHGRGHTNNDIVIRVDEVTFAGDLLEESAPPWFGDGYPLEWPATVEAMLTRGVFVPGHGDVMTRQMAEAQLADLRAVRDKVEACLASDDPISEGPYPMSVMETALMRAREVGSN